MSYGKDDHAMRPMHVHVYEYPENFPDSLTTLTGTFPEIFNWLSSDWCYEWICIQIWRS